MNFKMIVLDLDDTLLREDLTISERTKETLIRAQKEGVVVVLASGRPTFAMTRYAKELRLDEFGGFIISYNGAIVKDCSDDSVIFERTLTKEYARELYEISKKHNVFIHTYIGDNIVTPCMNQYTDVEKHLTGMRIFEVKDFAKTVDENVVKVLMLSEPTYLKDVENRVRDEVGHKMNLNISKPFFLEFMDKGIDKRYSLEILTEHLGINTNKIIAIGDSYNDLSMIKYAGMGVAMGNAPDDIKSEADYITDTNMEDGVASVVEELVLYVRAVS